MASPTKKTMRRRQLKSKTRGKERKRVLRSKGSTQSPTDLFKD
jgi:hypothetical protein